MFALCAILLPLPIGFGYTPRKLTCQVLDELDFQSDDWYDFKIKTNSLLKNI
jgi:hypothetical protein